MIKRALGGLIALLLIAGAIAVITPQNSIAGEIQEYTPNISAEEYEKRYNEFYGDATKKMEEEGNPAEMLLDDGNALFKKVDGSKGKSCASCHGQNGEKLKGAATIYPKYNAGIKGILTLPVQINRCRENQMGAKPWKYDTPDIVAVELFVKSLSNGMPIKISIDGPAKPFYEAGKKMYYTRLGQWNWNCATCHIKYSGHKTRANILSTNRHHADHWPTYRMAWQSTGTIQRRIINDCIKNMRVDKLPEYESEDIRNLEFYLTYQANGLPIQVPGLRF